MALVYDPETGTYYDDGTTDDDAVDLSNTGDTGDSGNPGAIYVWDDTKGEWVAEQSGTLPGETADTGLRSPTYWDQITSGARDLTWNDVRKLFAGTSPFGTAGQLAAVAGAGSLLNRMLGGGNSPGYAGYQGGIPTLTASRQQLPIPQTVTTPQGQTVPRRPGSGGITYFSPMTYAPAPAPTGATGGLTSLAQGGRFLQGPGDGVSDNIPAKFAETGKPARLADGEFVLDARTVSEIGNGSSEAGARKLYAFMEAVHKARKKAGRGSDSGADKQLKKLLA